MNSKIQKEKGGSQDDPIISPWVIYLIDKIDIVGILFFILWIAVCLGGHTVFSRRFVNYIYTRGTEDME